MIRRPAAVLALLTALNLLNYLDRYVLAAVLPKVRDELLLSNFVSGLMATVFLVGYFTSSPVFGYLADRGRRTRLITFGIVVWSVATVASGFAHTAQSLLFWRAIVGVGEASFTAIAPTLIDDVSPPTRKGRNLSVFYVAQPIGAALGYLIGGAIEHAYGWRYAFYLAGGPGLLLGFACLLVAEPERGERDKPNLRNALGDLRGSKQYRRALLGYCAYTFALGGFSYWAPTFLSDTFKVSLVTANFRFGLLTVVGGAVGTFLGGNLADRLQARATAHLGPAPATPTALEARQRTELEAAALLKLCAVGSLIATPIAAFCFLAPSSNAFFGAAFFCEVALFLSMSPINAVLLKSVPVHVRASAMAFAIFAIHLFGDLWSPPLVGLLADSMPTRIAMLTLAAAFGLSGYLWWPRRRDLTDPIGATSPA